MLQDKFGRRWSQSSLLFIEGLLLVVISLFANHAKDDYASMWGVTGLCLITKLLNSSSHYIVYLQEVELFPTPIRNTGTGFVYFVALVLGIPGSYVTHMGNYDKKVPYIFMASLSCVGSIAASFLPETLGCHLPETLQSASDYGRNQKYFSWKTQKRTHSDPEL